MFQAKVESARSRWAALAVLCAGALMIVLDQTIVNVALPAIQDDLGFTQTGLSWVVNAYLIPFAGLLLLAGRLGDLAGRTHVFLTGIAVFTLASLLCGLATTPELLIGARFLQGAGGAIVSAVILGMITTTFTVPRERATAFGAFSFVQAAGGTMGSFAGGVLTQIADWSWIFLINIPIGIAAVVAARRILPRDKGIGISASADLPGAALVTGSLMLAIYTIVTVEQYGWLSAHTLGLGLVAVVGVTAFLAREATAGTPLLPLSVFRSRNISGANLTQALLIAGMFGFQFLVVLYLRQVLGLDAMTTGLAMLPPAVAIGAVSIGLSARANTRFGERRVLLGGLTMIAIGFVLLAQVSVDGRYLTDVLPAMVVMGVGFGLSMPALIGLGMADAAADTAGAVSGLLNTTQQIGGALGLAVLAVLASTRTEHLIDGGVERAQALTDGFALSFTVGAGLVLAALLIAAVVITGARRRAGVETPVPAL
ncbi:DHA2 family efflux MFS transporter permease subunit [Rhodococcus sp. NPDC059234]|uniref:DHA2 family efflux MFS transporter permease subunit n=1 Tax=Rhodococcus sp. NPDC059234 TaxID=3346781 RepID=UPI00366FA4C1